LDEGNFYQKISSYSEKGEIDKLKSTEQHFKDDGQKIASVICFPLQFFLIIFQKTENLENSIEAYSLKLEEASERKRSYLHMLDRMKVKFLESIH